MSEYHDPIFTHDDAGNPIVTHQPFPNDYVVTDRTSPWEQQIAEKAGLRLVRLNADGRVATPQADYLHADDSVMDPSWRTIAATIRNEFHPAPVESPSAVTKPNTQPEANPAFGVVRFHKSDGVRSSVTETHADGSTSTYVVGKRSRFEEPPMNNEPKTFNPFAVNPDDYAALRRQGYVPKVVVTGPGGAPAKAASSTFDMEAYRVERTSDVPRTEMELFMASRNQEIEALKKEKARQMALFANSRSGAGK